MLSHRFALIIAGLCDAVAARGGRDRTITPLIVMLWGRLSRMAVRFEALVTRLCQGRLPAAPILGRRIRARSQPSAVPPQRLPRGFAWLVRLAQGTAAFASRLQHLLADPEMALLLTAAPGLGRILRPLCHMLAIRLGPELRAPQRRTKAKPEPCQAGETKLGKTKLRDTGLGDTGLGETGLGETRAAKPLPYTRRVPRLAPAVAAGPGLFRARPFPA